MSIKRVQQVLPGDSQLIEDTFEVFKYLRPHLTKEEFLIRVAEQFKQGYEMICLREHAAVVAAAGFRFGTFLAWGRVLYIDDLITHPNHTREGYAGILLAWLDEKAKQEKCDQVHLDSGYQRLDAHRLYLNNHFHLTSHHFSKAVK